MNLEKRISCSDEGTLGLQKQSGRKRGVRRTGAAAQGMGSALAGQFRVKQEYITNLTMNSARRWLGL